MALAAAQILSVPPPTMWSMTTRKPCQDQVVVSAELAAAIVAIDSATWDYGVDGVAGEPWPCDLAAAHLGAHMAHVQTTPRDVDYWLRWTGSLDVVMVTEPVCEAALELAEDDEVFCLLPERRDGPHHSGKQEWT
jgi:hypothetical protein